MKSLVDVILLHVHVKRSERPLQVGEVVVGHVREADAVGAQLREEPRIAVHHFGRARRRVRIRLVKPTAMFR